MSKVLINPERLTDIADALREVTGSTDKWKPADMPAVIRELNTGGGESVDVASLLASIATGAYPWGDYTGTEQTIKTTVYAKQPGLISYSNNNLTVINVDRAFDACNQMTSFSAPNLETLSAKSSIFTGCLRLTSVNIGKVTELPPLTFYGCNNLAYIPNAERLTYIGQQCFPYNAAITIADLPKLERLDSFSFSGCGNLREVHLLSIIELKGNIFNNCHKLEVVEIGAKCTKIDRSFMQGSKADVMLIIQATTPPSLNGSFVISGSILSIKVPAGSVDTYKSASNWSNYAPLISAI